MNRPEQLKWARKKRPFPRQSERPCFLLLLLLCLFLIMFSFFKPKTQENTCEKPHSNEERPFRKTLVCKHQHTTKRKNKTVSSLLRFLRLRLETSSDQRKKELFQCYYKMQREMRKSRNVVRIENFKMLSESKTSWRESWCQ